MQHQKWTEGMDNGSIYLFKQKDCRKDMKESLRSFEGCGGN